MNLLFFVMATLFLMSAITLGRFDSFLKLQWQSQEWRERMLLAERSVFNVAMVGCDFEKKEKSATGRVKDADSASKTTKGNGRLSQKWLLDPEFRRAHESTVLVALEFVKSLMRDLYQEQPFYKKILLENPQFLEEMVGEIMRLSDLYKQENLKKALSMDALLEMRWNDERMRVAFARMVQESLLYQAKKREKREPLPEGFEINKDEMHENVSYAREGYISIKDYFTPKATDKIRLWLADPLTLLVLFKEASIVEAIVKRRSEIYREISRKSAQSNATEMAKARLEEEFPASLSPYSDLIDYTVTKTNPKKI